MSKLTFKLVGELGYILETLGISFSTLVLLWIHKGCNNNKPESDVDHLRGLVVSRMAPPYSSKDLIDGCFSYTHNEA